MVVTTRALIIPRTFHEQAIIEFPSVVEVTGKAGRIKEAGKERRYISAQDDDA